MTSNRCQACGLVNFAGTVNCRRCQATIVWGAEGGASQPEYSSSSSFNAGGDAHQHQPFQAAPSLANYGTPSAGYASAYAPTGKLRSGQATTSLVLGVLGIFTLGILVIGSLIGLVLGIRAVLKAKQEPLVYGGKGVAIGGIVTNSFGILTMIPVAIIAAIAIPNLIMARMFANEANAIGHLRTLGNAEYTYQSSLGGGRTFASMEELIASGAIPRDSAHRNGYQFKIRLLDEDGNAASPGSDDAVSFEVVATPISYGSTGRRSFYVSEEYVIRCADRKGKEATRDDPDVDEAYEEQEQFDRSRPGGSYYAPRGRN